MHFSLIPCRTRLSEGRRASFSLGLQEATLPLHSQMRFARFPTSECLGQIEFNAAKKKIRILLLRVSFQ